MRKISTLTAPLLSLGLALGLALSLVPATAGQAPAREMGPRTVRSAPSVEDGSQARVIVKYRSGSTLMTALSAGTGTAQKVLPQHAARLGQRLGYALQDGRVLGERTQALRGQGLASSDLAARLRAQADVEWAVVDERRYINTFTALPPPNDPYYGPNQSGITPAVGQWYLRAPDSTFVSAINAPAAWNITAGSASVVVAVLDTGVRFDHPDLNTKLLPGYDFVSDATNGDGNGRDADASDPGDYTTTNQCGAGTAASSSSWHGTQTAGLVGAATDNNIGMASVGRNVMVLPVRVLGKCGGTDSDIIAAMYWAAGLTTSPVVNPHPAKVISMSLGKSGSCPASYQDVFSALAAAGVTVVVAAGNDAGLAVGAPANCSGALAVAGVRHIGSKVGYSSIGPQVAIAAPAGNCVNTSGPCLYPILTTINAGSTTPSTNTYSDSYDYSVGTSFATPIVAGAVALMLSVDPTLGPAAIKAKLQATARPFPTSGSTNADGTPNTTVAACKPPSSTEQLECYCTTATCGAGLLDVGAAVAAVAPVAVAPPVAAISVSNAAPTAGATVTLGGSGSTANGGRSIASYQWAVTGGSTLAAISGASTGSTATLVTSAAGAVTVSLTVTDSAGASGTTTSTVNVQAAAASTPVTPTAAGGGGGGGAFSSLWLGLLALGVAVLWRVRPAA